MPTINVPSSDWNRVSFLLKRAGFEVGGAEKKNRPTDRTDKEGSDYHAPAFTKSVYQQAIQEVAKDIVEMSEEDGDIESPLATVISGIEEDIRDAVAKMTG